MFLNHNPEVMDKLITCKEELLEAIKSDPVMEYEYAESDEDIELYINLASGCFGCHGAYVTYCSCVFELDAACGAEIGSLNMAYPFRYRHIAYARDMIESAACEWLDIEYNNV